MGGTTTSIASNETSTTYSTAFAPGSNHILLTIDALTTSGGASSVTATITGTQVSESSGIPSSSSSTEDIVFSASGSSAGQSLKKWYYISQIVFTPDAGSIDSIQYDIATLGYIDFLNTNVNITGYRLEALGDFDGSQSDIGIQLITVSQSGSTTTLTDIENISVDGDGGTGTGAIIDSLRTGAADRSFTMPAGASIWPQNTNFVFKATDFDSFFTSDQNIVTGASNGGLIVKLTSNAFGGTNGPRYATISIYYSEV